MHIKNKDELDVELCEYCPLTEDGRKVNSGPHNICEGVACDQAYANYVDVQTEEAQNATM